MAAKPDAIPLPHPTTLPLGQANAPTNEWRH
jgi:hypothetical protein